MAQQGKRKRRTKAQIEADKAKEFKEQQMASEFIADVEKGLEEVAHAEHIKKSTPKDPNPSITFLRKDGQPVYLLLHIAISKQQMKEREYALGYKEQFADERIAEKVDGIMYEGRPAIETLKEMYSI